MNIATELRDLARNLWWSWHPNAIALFRDLDPALWRESNHNPVAFLSQISSEHLEESAVVQALEARINHTFHRQNEYLERRRSWGDIHSGPLQINPVVYFSAEFGLHESLPLYSGGLGILAGDHLKSASDLGIPIVGVGLLYDQGYFHQHLDASGWQQENYLETDIQNLPVEEVKANNGEPLRIVVITRSERIALRIWRANVGRAALLLLDSNVAENSETDRHLTGRLYGGDLSTRIRQELILGVGGARVLAAVGIQHGVIHLNEGHCAFAILEKARLEMETDGVDFQEAMRRISARTVFTTHTPVEAGHDRFDAGLVEEVLGPMRDALNLSMHDLMALGRVNPQDTNEPFCMTVMGLKSAWKSNAVSTLHAKVSRRMWKPLWPGNAESEIPIGHISNGVHVASWLAPSMRQLYDTYLGTDWDKRMDSPETWAPINNVDSRELWEAHQIVKTRLVNFVQRQVCMQESRRTGASGLYECIKKQFTPLVLTIGFARRFATYKRSDLIFSDMKRLERIVCNPDRPVQIILAGKAHPMDEPAKHLIRHLFEVSREPRFMGRILFLEDYDINVARHIVQGVDLWLNTPRRPREASGTSGMKACFNGVLNLSVLDGWWAEAYNGSNGFAVGSGGEHVDIGEQDRRDAESLYATLEQKVVPLYYNTNGSVIPEQWISRMKKAVCSLAWRYNANRMVLQYARECYLPIVGAGQTQDC